VTGIALIGAGTIGRIHARNIAANPRCSLRWVVDQDAGRATELATAYGGRATTSVKPALSDDHVEAVIIASSTSAHGEHLAATIAARKPLLCEKPIADDLEYARRSTEAVAGAGLLAAIAFNRRYDSSLSSIHDRIRGGEIGKVELIHIVSRTNPPVPAPQSVRFSGGMLREKGAHHYDLAAWMAGAEPIEVLAMGDCLVDPDFAKYGDLDTAVLTLRFDSGALATFSFSRRSVHGYDETIEVFGSEGMIESRRPRVRDVSVYKQGRIVEDGLHGSWYDRFAPTYETELDQFLLAVAGQPAVLATLNDGLRAQAVAEGAIRSFQTGQVVGIDRIW
jgi:myo-inositol 2-dehydrogenase/D-chiro-inositol 1-dehydrogenase